MGVRRNVFARLLKPRMSAFGLEITSNSLKLVELRGSGPFTVSAASVRDIPAGAIAKGEILDFDLVAHMLREEHRVSRIRSRYAISTIMNHNVVTRNIQMPNLPAAELGEALKWEAERYIPFPMADVSFDYEVLPPQPGVPDDEITVTIVAARLEHVTRQAELIKRAGLEPLAIDTKSFSLLRTFSADFQSANPGSVVLLLEIGGGITTLTAVRNSTVLLNRNIAISGDTFTEALMRYFDIDFNTAERLKVHHGTVVRATDGRPVELEGRHVSRAQIYEALRPTLFDLTAEVRRSVDFLTVQLGEVELHNMLITGGATGIHGMAEAMGQILEIPVRAPDPFQNVSDPGNLLASRVPALMAVPIGLAIRGAIGND